MVTAVLERSEKGVLSKLEGGIRPHLLFWDDGGISIFGQYGRISDDVWEVSFEADPERLVELIPCPQMGVLTFIVKGAVDRMQGEPISFVLITARMGLFLYLEGAITREQLESCSMEDGCMEFQMSIDGQIYMINLVADATDGEIGAYFGEFGGVLI